LTPKANSLMGMPLLLVFEHLTVKFIHDEVDCGVKVRILTLSEEFFAFNVQIYLDFLLKFIDGHKNIGIHNLVKVSVNPFEFTGEIAAQGWCNFDMMAVNGQIHTSSLVENRT
jgi:hypothetical protein